MGTRVPVNYPSTFLVTKTPEVPNQIISKGNYSDVRLDGNDEATHTVSLFDPSSLRLR